MDKYIVEFAGNDISIKSDDMNFSTFRNGEQTFFQATNPECDDIVDRAYDYCYLISEHLFQLNELLDEAEK